jgi:hypothetical protein
MTDDEMDAAMAKEAEARKAAEAKLAAEQDAALDAVRSACDAERAAMGQPTSDAPQKWDKA